MNTETRVRRLVQEHVELPEDAEAPLELSSWSLVVLTEALETEFGIRVAARELVPENFASLARIVRFIAGRGP